LDIDNFIHIFRSDSLTIKVWNEAVYIIH